MLTKMYLQFQYPKHIRLKKAIASSLILSQHKRKNTKETNRMKTLSYMQ